MWKRSELKKRARPVLKRNYIAVVAACFIIAVLTGAYSFSTMSFTEGGLTEMSNSQIVEAVLDDIAVKPGETPYRGVLGSAVNLLTQSSSPVFRAVDTVRSFIYDNGVLESIISLIGFLMMIAFYVFISNILEVGEKRFFLENRLYANTRISRIAFIYAKKKTLRTAWTVAIRSIYLFFWSLTIVGGIIKVYSYKMIPYILAENPGISRKEAFSLSRAMMKGNKWKAFLLDLSFFWWFIPMVLTFGLLGFFWVNPYMAAANAELYMVLRQDAIDKKIPHYELLNDEYLVHKPDGEGEMTPALQEDGTPKRDLYPGLKQPKVKGNRVEYSTHYNLTSLILLFFTFAFVGWLWEVSLHLIKDGVFCNRGVMLGPWLPIYGFGGVAALVLLKKLFFNPVLTFFAMMTVSGVVEYFTSWYLEVTKGAKWWDYTGYFANLNGRICLEGLIIFGLGGCACIYFLAPKLNSLFEKIPNKIKIPVCALLVCVFGIDVIHSNSHPNMGAGITDYSELDFGAEKLISKPGRLFNKRL